MAHDEDAPQNNQNDDAPQDVLDKQIDKDILRLAIAEASIRILEQYRQPMSPREIASCLENIGYPFVKDDAANAVGNALVKRVKFRNDVVRVERGKWAIRGWYTQERLDQILGALNKRPERDADYHAKRVREAQAKAQARGVRMGRVPFEELYSPELIMEYKALRSQGVRVKDAINMCSIPFGTYKKYRALLEDGQKYQTAEDVSRAAMALRGDLEKE